MAESRFVGTWRLESLSLTEEDGTISYPMGEDPVGYIIYSGDGFMSVGFMRVGRAGFASGDSGQATDEEKIAAAESHMAYCGRYEVLEDRVVHHIEVSSFPNWAGTSQERFFCFEGNRLILTTPPDRVYGKTQTARVVWHRAD
jgi:lipocalin-like protein